MRWGAQKIYNDKMKKTENNSMDQNAALKKFKFAASVFKQKEYDHAVKNFKNAIALGLPEKLEIDAKNQIALAYIEISKEAFSNFKKVFEAFKDRLINSQFNKQRIPFLELSAHNKENFDESTLNQATVRTICNNLARDLHSISKKIKIGGSYAQDNINFNSILDSFFKSFYEKHKGDDYFIRCIRILSMSSNSRGGLQYTSPEKLNQIEQFKYEIKRLLKSSADDSESNVKKRANDELIFIRYQNSLVNKLFGNDVQIDEILKDVVGQSTVQNTFSFELENKQTQENSEIKKGLNFDQALQYFTIGLQNSNEGEYESAIENLEKLLRLNKSIIEKIEKELELDKPLMEIVNATLASSYVNSAPKIKMGDYIKGIELYEKCLLLTKIKYDFAFACHGISSFCNYKGNEDSEFIILEKLFLILSSKIEEGSNELKTNDFNSLILKLKDVQWKEKIVLFNALADKLLAKNEEKVIPEKLPSPIKEVLEKLDSMTENPSQLDNSNLPIMKNAIENEYNGENKNGNIEDALKRIAVAKRMNSEFLDLSDCGLMELPESLFELVNLIKLDLSYNEIKEIPEDFSKLVSLVELNLNGNQIQKIPESLFKLVNLKKLYLSNNEIKEIPEDFSKLVNLVELELDCNQIQIIPVSFCKLFKLEYIDLSENEITEIPESFVKIVGLTKIDLFGNPIEEIISKSEQFLSREKDTVFTNTTNAPSDVDGWVSIKYYRHGLYMKEFLPLGNGKHPTLQDVLQNLKKRGIKRPPEETIQSFLLSKLTEYKRLGDSKLKPFAEARVIVDFAEIDKKIYVSFLPPKTRGRDLEVIDVVYEIKKEVGDVLYELKKEGIDYEINEEVIREALELEKYNNPIAIAIAIVKEKEKITYAIANTHNFIKAGNFQNALDSINEAIELGLKLPVTYYNRGYIQFQLKNWVGAIQDYSEAIKLNPLDAENYNAKGRALFEIGKLEEALEDFSKAIVMNQNYEDAYYNRGVCYRFLDKLDKAIADFAKAILLNGRNSNSYFQMGMVYEDLDDTEKAIANYAQALAITPNDVDVLLQKANLEFSIRNYSQTIQTCSQVVKFQPENKQAYLLRALAKTKSGDLLGALEDSTKGE